MQQRQLVSSSVNWKQYPCSKSLRAFVVGSAHFGLIVLESVGLVHDQHGPINGLQNS